MQPWQDVDVPIISRHLVDHCGHRLQHMHFFSGREREVMEIYEKRHQANLHKMVPIPVCEIPREWKI